MTLPLIPLPEPVLPIGAYQAAIVRGRLGMVSGQFPRAGGSLIFPGRVGDGVSLGDAGQAARLAALNVCAQIGQVLGGWQRFGGLLRVEGIVAADPTFTDHASVLDHASAAFVEALGQTLGAHARSASSALSLPGGACVELVASFRVEGGQP